MRRSIEDKSILKLEGNYLRSERSNNGFILLMAVLSNCIEYLSHKLGVTFYDVVSLCSVEIIRHLLTIHMVSKEVTQNED